MPELIFQGQHYPAVIGRGGLIAAMDKGEGDGCTPMGTWPLRACWYRPDRIPIPHTQLPLRAIQPDDGWCDDPKSTRYNSPIILNTLEELDCDSYEHLWREDHAYDLIIPLGYNDDPVIPRKGSAIFLHCMHSDRRPTAGCVALEKNDLLALLPKLSQSSYIDISHNTIMLHA